jgi:hypothetical protein
MTTRTLGVRTGRSERQAVSDWCTAGMIALGLVLALLV